MLIERRMGKSSKVMCVTNTSLVRIALRVNLKKNGKTGNKKQKYLCKDCHRQVITDYSYQGCRSNFAVYQCFLM